MGAEYVLVTDSGCDLSPETLKEWNIGLICLAYLFTDDGVEKKEHEQPLTEFYAGMRNGRAVFRSRFRGRVTSGIPAGNVKGYSRRKVFPFFSDPPGRRKQKLFRSAGRTRTEKRP